MALIDPKSTPSTKSELDLFTVPPTQVMIKQGFWEEIPPTNPITNEGPYIFHIPPDPHYIQMHKNYIYMQLKIKKPNLPTGTEAATGQVGKMDVAPINLIGKTFFKQVKCFLSGKLVFDSSDMYAYRAYFETELNYGLDAKKSHLQSALYNQETGSNVDSKDNSGFKQRVKLFQNEAVVEVLAPLHIDLFLQDRNLLNFTDLRIELYRNNNSFTLLSFDSTDVELQVSQMKLLIRKVEILESANLALEHVLSQYPAYYPIRRVVMTNLHLSNPARETPHHTLFTGQLPRRIVFAYVDGSAFRGSLKHSPFNFKPLSVIEAKVICGGKTFPAHPFVIDFNNNKHLHAYNQLFEGLDIGKDNKGNGITREAFTTSHAFFVFDLTPDEEDNGHLGLIREGTTSINIKFREELPPNGIEIIVYAEFDNLIMIDKNRNVFYDYS